MRKRTWGSSLTLKTAKFIIEVWQKVELYKFLRNKIFWENDRMFWTRNNWSCVVALCLTMIVYFKQLFLVLPMSS